jgi:hypothetical protein
MEDFDRVRFLTENYTQLQGLKWIPIGLYFLFYGAFSLLFFDEPFFNEPFYGTIQASLAVLLTVSVVAGVLWLHRVAGRYYERRYGHVRHRPWYEDRQPLSVVLGICVLLVLFLVNWIVHPPVDLALLAFGTAMFVSCWPDRRFRLHYLIMTALFVGASFLPLLGVWSTNLMQEPSTGNVFTLFFGLYYVVGGIFDHLLLVRTMKSIPEEGDGGAV